MNQTPPTETSVNLQGLRVAVVGAGVMGSWTALHLMERGAEVTVVEPWSPGHSRSSSGGETRVIRGVYGPDRLYTSWVKDAFRAWGRLEHLVGQQLYIETGLLWMFNADDSYMATSRPLAEEFGFEIEPLSSAQAIARFDNVNFEDVRHVYVEKTAGFLFARKACELLGEHLRRSGVTFVTGAVQDLLDVSQKTRAVRLKSGEVIEADRFVFACGPWLPMILPNLLNSVLKPSRQEVYYFGVPESPTGFSTPSFPVWVDFSDEVFYGVPNVAGRGFKIANDTRGPSIDPTSLERIPSSEGIDKARAFLARRFPSLIDAPLVESRICQYTNSFDGRLLIDRHPDADHVWIVGGGSGHGFKLGPSIGRYVADCIAETQSPIEALRLSQHKTDEGDVRTQLDVNRH